MFGPLVIVYLCEYNFLIGATMYEILEGGAVPYCRLISNKEVVNEVMNGLKLEKPTNVSPSDELWAIMQSCWLKPDQRPSFKEIHHQLSLPSNSAYEHSPLEL